MLEAMRGENEVVSGIGDAAEKGGFAQPLGARCARRIKVERTSVAQTAFPSRLRGEVHVVDAVCLTVNR